MKTLLLIIAIAGMSFGCEAQSNIIVGLHRGTEPSLEEKLLLYAQECWNDSSKYCYRLICDWNCIEIECDCGATHEFGFPCMQKYIHRKPTFEGFIEWLKNK